MGLDNYPRNLPCKSQGTAVLVPRKDRDGNVLVLEDGSPDLAIDCKATQDCGGCPYKNDFEASGLASGAVYGIFGTDCWYRGKYGNYLLQAIDYHESIDFYGDQENGTYKSPESCLEVATVIDEAFEEYGEYHLDGEDITDDLKYASWYLKWAAEKCDGLAAWY